MSPRENWRGFSTSRASTMRPAQVPKMGLPAAWNFSIAGTNSHSPMSLSSVVDSPPGMMSPATSASASGLRTSTASTPERASARAWSAKSPWRASTPTRTLFSFTDSPRLRLPLALPPPPTRLASGCGSHYPLHRLASPPAAARTTPSTDSPRLRLRLALPPPGLEQVLLGELRRLDPDHRVAELLAHAREHVRVLVVGRRLHNRLGAPGRVARLEDPGADEDGLRPELHHERGVRRGRDPALRADGDRD